jgi:hypothetical protein
LQITTLVSLNRKLVSLNKNNCRPERSEGSGWIPNPSATHFLGEDVLHEGALPALISVRAQSDSDSVVDGLESCGYSRRTPASAFDGVA